MMSNWFMEMTICMHILATVFHQTFTHPEGFGKLNIVEGGFIPKTKCATEFVIHTP